MPENLDRFRQNQDERHWITRIKIQDRTDLAPYIRWIAANEEDAEKISTSASADWESRFLTICVSAKNRLDFESVNEKIRSCHTPYIILHVGDIRFSPGAFFVFSEAAGREPGPDFIYSDEDLIDESGVRFDPFFKPGWSPDTLMSFLYTGRVGVFRTDLLKEVGGLRAEYGDAAYYDLVLRFTEKAKRICHISRVLYHIPVLGQDSEKACVKAEDTDRNVGCGEAEHLGRNSECVYIRDLVRVKEDALRRRKLAGNVTWNERTGEAEVVYSVQREPLVSIIIPSRDHYEMLSACLRSIREHTGYPHYELIIVDNGSSAEQRKMIEELTGEYGARYLYHPMPFNFSVMCNLGAEAAGGEYLLFLNDDIEALHEDWLEKMLGQAQLPHAGAVGAKLLYPESGLIQHAGIVNLVGSPAHALMGLSDEKDWYYHRNTMTYNFSAVTGACLMVSAQRYREAGGMDENLSVAYNDVGLCFRLMELGYRNSVRNDAVLLHYESASRGLDRQSEEKQERLARERALLYRLYPKMKEKDPCYNKNLTQAGNDYSLNMLFTTKPCGYIRGPLKDSGVQFPYSIEKIEKIVDTWEIFGWISVGSWQEYLVRRYMVLESEDGGGVCFPLNRIRLFDEKLDRIRDKNGKLFTPFVWFHIMIKEKDLPGEGLSRIVLMVKEMGRKDILILTEHWLSAQS